MAAPIPNSAASRANTHCVRLACERLGLPLRIHDPYGNFLSVELDRPYYFVNYVTPFNDSAVARICKDKEFTYRLLKDVIRMPRTQGYFDPYPNDASYSPYVVHEDYDAIASRVLDDFSLPVVLKMNSGSQGKNVFLCTTADEVRASLRTIFDHQSSAYDYVAIAQEYVVRKKEYRVIVFQREVLLAYEKDFSDATFIGNLSPLHYENARAIQVHDARLISTLQEALAPIFPVLDVQFVGVDVILDEQDQLHVLELNAQPGFSYFVRDNGEEPLVQMYMTLLQTLVASANKS